MILASFVTTILTIVIVTVCVLLIGLVLLQKNRGAGLSGAFGGVGGHSAFGTKTGDMLTWVTVGLAAVFLLLAVVANYVFVPETPVIAAPAAPEGTAQPTGAQPVSPTPVQPAMPLSPMPGQGAPPSPSPGQGQAPVPINLQPMQGPPPKQPPTTPPPTPPPAAPAPGTTP
jgi:preprotein translocase subunit SecG